MDRIAPCLAGGSDHTIDPILQTACKAVLTAGEIIRHRYGKPHQIRYKDVIDLVTEADLASEEAILGIVTADFPGITVMSEESRADYSSTATGATWIIDPLDGTTNFAHSFPHFGVSIGFAVAGVTLAGVIYCPMQNELFCGGRGKGAWLNGREIAVSTASDLQHSLVATGFPYDVHGTLPQIIDTLRRVLPRVQDIRRPGAAALDLAYVACGRLDAFWEMNLKPWDTAAGALLVEEAGGTLSDFKGEAFSVFRPEIVASNGQIHHELVELL